MSNRSFWTTCEKCGQRIYMAYVLPPNEYSRRYIPFDDELLNDCHLDYCITKRKTINKELKKKKSSPSYTVCPICNCKLREKNKEKHMRKVHWD